MPLAEYSNGANVWTVSSSQIEEQKVDAMPTKLVCLVIMPFGQSQHHDREYWENHFKNFIKPAIENAANGQQRLGYEARRADFAGGSIPNDVLKNLLVDADVVLADLTDTSPNVMYELGIRHSVRGQTIMIIEQGQDLPFYFNHYRAISYSTGRPADMHSFQLAIEQRLLDMQHVAQYSDNPVSSYLQNTGQQIRLFVQQAWEQHQARQQAKDFTAIYTPDDNDRRNARKLEVLQNTTKPIQLIASSGYAYLGKYRNLFWRALQERLRTGVPVHIILEHPFSDSRVQLTLGELIPDKPFPTPIQQVILEKYRQGSLNSFDPVTFIEQSDHYIGKYLPSLRGYEDLKLQFGDLIELRISTFPLPATILLTVATGFFEVYIRAQSRTDHPMNTFELEFPDSHYLHSTCKNYFDFLWQTSLSYTEFQTSIDFWKEHLKKEYAR
jgi:hypothetical protein